MKIWRVVLTFDAWEQEEYIVFAPTAEKALAYADPDNDYWKDRQATEIDPNSPEGTVL